MPISLANRMKAQWPRALCLAAAAALLAGCQTDYVTGSAVIDDYHDRHPIVLADAPATLDVFPVNHGALDVTTLVAIRAFADRYARYGVGRIVVLAPAGGGPDIRAGVASVRRALAADGLRGSIGLGVYPVADLYLASPIKIGFRGLKAEVASRCGEWPSDLTSGSSLEGWQNRTYWNFGCATQSMLAAQVDDPRDFVQASALAPSDVQMRLRAIGKVRGGDDPGTAWTVQNSNIGQIGGQ
ncbi:MAG TPA: CpaD family pilus assembly protein [Roseiarcus sp.]|nr:CpaD family pilus assembly protein [Roseiarcus sp.]